MQSYKITNREYKDNCYYCNIHLDLYCHTIPLQITSSSEITEEEINNYIEQNIDSYRRNLYHFEKNIQYESMYTILERSKIYLDELGNVIPSDLHSNDTNNLQNSPE